MCFKQFFENPKRDWVAALLFCESQGYDLAVITNPEETDAAKTATKNIETWIGLDSQTTGARSFGWSDGSVSLYSNWAPYGNFFDCGKWPINKNFWSGIFWIE